MEQTSRRIAQLTLLSRLGQALNAATDLASLCNIIPAVLLEHSAAACIILRPALAEESDLKPYYLRAETREQPQLAYFLQQEAQASEKVLRSGRSQLITPLDGQGKLPPCLYCVPLRVHAQDLGTLSFLGGSDEGHSPFRLEQQQLMLTCSFQIAQAIEQQLTLARLRRVSAADARNLQDISLLYRISQLLHSTLATDDLMHLILSLLVHPQGGAFQRAMLFMVNERSNSLQGILGVTRESAGQVLPKGLPAENQRLQIAPEALTAQQQTDFSREVMQMRLALDSQESCLARVVREQQALLINHPLKADTELARRLALGDHACIPLIARQQVLCVLAVDNQGTKDRIDEQRLRFLELFAAQAGIAIDNSQLVQRIESAHRSLRETQERLLQREKMATIGEMSALAAHELRNPLASIGGFARRLSRKLPSETDELQYATIIHEETKRLEKMLDKILSFARQQELKPMPFPIDQVLEQALMIEGEKLHDAGINLILDLANPLPDLHGDAEQIGQVLVNLLSNARQSMPSGGHLTLRVTPAHLRGEDAIRIEVIDNGEGIPPEMLRSIFTPFVTTRKQGTGLGLSICQRIIEHHQGELTAANRDQGAVFSITLPLRLQQRPDKSSD